MSNRPRHEAKLAEGAFVVSFRDFAGLSTATGECEYSPKVMCLGRYWMIGIYPGGSEGSGDGMAAVTIVNMSDQSISFAVSLVVRNSSGIEIVSLSHEHANFGNSHVTIMPQGNGTDAWIVSDFVSRTTILDTLIDGALVIEVRMRLTDPGGVPLIPLPIENPFCKSIEGSFEVSFREFAELSTERGKFKDSPTFTCLGRKWRVRIYPGGEKNSGDGMVALAIGTGSRSNQSVSFVYSFGIRNSAGREIVLHDGFDRTPTLLRFDRTPTLLADYRQGESGIVVHDFASRSALLGALIDGALVIDVRLRLVDPADMPPRLLDKESADVVFEVETDSGESNKTQTAKKKAKTQTLFHAHRSIIEKRAPMLYELCKEGGRIRMNDVKSNVFRNILSYFYGGELSDKTLGANAREFIDFADRYGAVHLKLKAEAEYVKAAISLDNAMDALLYADAKNCALLKEAVMDFLVENNDEAIKKISFGNAPGHLMKDLLMAVNARDRKTQGNCNDANDYSVMRVDSLRRKLQEKGLDIDGSREAMVALLEKHS